MTLNWWERFLDSLSTEGGHIAVWFCLILVGVLLALCSSLSFSERIVTDSILGLALILKAGSVRSNKTRQETSVASSTVTEESQQAAAPPADAPPVEPVV